MITVAVVNGPNLNLLGRREPHIYGRSTWQEIRADLEEKARDLGIELEFFHSNHEGAIIDHLQGLAGRARGLVINPGALSHYSYSLRDAVSAIPIPVVEVHISNIHAREEWRSRSVISEAADGVICGLGPKGYELALEAVLDIISRE